MSPCSPSRRDSVCSTFCSPLTTDTNKCAKFFSQLTSFPQAELSKSGTVLIQDGVRDYWILKPPDGLGTLPGRLNPDSTALTQFVPRLANVKRFEDLPFDPEWFFVPNCAVCDDSIITCEPSLGIGSVGIETRCMVLYSPTSLLNSLLCLEQIATAVQRYQGTLHVFFKGQCVLG